MPRVALVQLVQIGHLWCDLCLPLRMARQPTASAACQVRAGDVHECHWPLTLTLALTRLYRSLPKRRATALKLVLTESGSGQLADAAAASRAESVPNSRVGRAQATEQASPVEAPSATVVVALREQVAQLREHCQALEGLLEVRPAQLRACSTGAGNLLLPPARGPSPRPCLRRDNQAAPSSHKLRLLGAGQERRGEAAARRQRRSGRGDYAATGRQVSDDGRPGSAVAAPRPQHASRLTSQAAGRPAHAGKTQCVVIHARVEKYDCGGGFLASWSLGLMIYPSTDAGCHGRRGNVVLWRVRHRRCPGGEGRWRANAQAAAAHRQIEHAAGGSADPAGQPSGQRCISRIHWPAHGRARAQLAPHRLFWHAVCQERGHSAAVATAFANQGRAAGRGCQHDTCGVAHAAAAGRRGVHSQAPLLNK